MLCSLRCACNRLPGDGLSRRLPYGTEAMHSLDLFARRDCLAQRCGCCLRRNVALW
jgi:hypothetical protein